MQIGKDVLKIEDGFMRKNTSNYADKSLVYMDNAATSWPKPRQVWQEMEACVTNYCANPGRGSHKMSERSMEVVTQCRVKVANLINAPDFYNNVIFTKNCTEATNHLLYGVLKPGDHVVVSPMEHNAVMRPLWHMEQVRGIKLNFLNLDALLFNPQRELKRKLTSKTKLIVCMLSSNVTGLLFPIRQIGEFARAKGIPFFVDAAQGMGSQEINVVKDGISMLTFPGHKNLYGPQGTGGFWIADYIDLTPLLRGGTGVNSSNKMQGRDFPNEYESGTMNVPGIAGLLRGIDFVETYGLENIRKYKNCLLEDLCNGLSKIKGVKVVSEQCPAKNSGIVSINIDGYNSRKVAEILDSQYNIAVRGGLHCAPQAHRQIGTFHQGCVRFSPGVFNTIYDVEKCIEAVIKIATQI